MKRPSRTLMPPVLVLLGAVLAATPLACADTSAPAAPAEPQPVAIVAGAPISRAQLDEAAESQLAQLRTQEYEIRKQVLDNLIIKALIESEAAARGMTAEELVRQEIEAKTPQVTDQEVQAFYDANQGRFGNRTEEEVLKLLKPSLQQQKVNQRRDAYIAELRAKAGVKILLEAPRIEVAEGNNPAVGPADAPVTIVEFSDFQCPFCGRVNPTIDQIRDTYGDKVRLVFRDFPLGMHPQAPKAAEAAECANEQGKFWQMHDSLFANQSALQVDDLKNRAVQIGLDATQFNECLDSGKYTAAVQADMRDGSSYGVTGTPAFFINGRSLSGAQPFQKFAEIINEELERKGVPIPTPGTPTAQRQAAP